MSFYGTLGQKWTISHRIGLLTQASAGIGVSDYDIKFTWDGTVHALNISDTSFYYSLLLGLDFQLSRSWHAALFYELDGRSEIELLITKTSINLGLKSVSVFDSFLPVLHFNLSA